MKKFISTILMVMFAVSLANASHTKVEIGLAGDAYYTTDNASVGMGERAFATSNIFKDRFGTNNVLLNADVSNKDWKTNFSIVSYGKTEESDGIGMEIEDANIGFRLYEGLWFTGGLFAVWDVDYTFDRWFTGNSLTDYRNMAGPYMAFGLEYNFTDDVTLGAGLMNSNSEGHFEMPNLSKSIYAKFDWNNFYEDWGLTLGCITGNTAHYGAVHENSTEIYLTTGGTIIDKLEGKLSFKFFNDAIDEDGVDALSTLTFQALLRYRFCEKFSAGARFSFYSEDVSQDYSYSGIDFGIVCEYNPTPDTYIRLEGGMLSLSSDHETLANRFLRDNVLESSRLGVALSMGFRFGLFEAEIGK